MRVLLIGAILLFGSYSFANFSGTWAGDAIITLSDGRQGYCDEIIINVSQSDEKIEFGKFRYACGELAVNFNPPTLELSEKKASQDVFWKGEKIGEVTSSKANLLFNVSETGKARYTVNKLSDTELDYVDDQIGINPETGEEKVTTIHATLKKVQSN